MAAIRDWFRNIWLKTKAWFVGVLIAIGLIVPALGEVVDFNYTRATQRVDGSPLLESEIQSTRLYCDGVMIAEEPGADQDFQVDLGVGSHTCHATHVDTNDQESDPSNIVVKVVNPARPNPPENLQL